MMFPRPSGAPRWNRCAASVQLAAAFPGRDNDSEHSADGTAAHEVGATMVREAARGATVPESIVGTVATNGVVITPEMYEGAQVYADDVAAVMRATGCFVPHVEETMPIPDVYPTQTGTPDCWLFDQATMTLYIWDFKFGFRIVDVFECLQLVDYYAGILRLIAARSAGLTDQRLQVVFRIVQPRAFHRAGPVREWSTTGSELRAMVNQLSHAAHAAMAPNPTATPGDHCQYCPAAHGCAALKQAAYIGADYANGATPDNMSPDAVGVELRNLHRIADILAARIAGVEAEAEALLRSGKRIPFYTLESGRGRETWAKPLDEVFALGDLMGVNLRKPAAVTPKQARTLGLDASVCSAFTHTPETGLKLVQVNNHQARQIFAQESTQ